VCLAKVGQDPKAVKVALQNLIQRQRVVKVGYRI